MAIKNLLITAFLAYFIFNYMSQARAQDTFGPICDDVTVTCIPTETPATGASPTPSIETTPTETPTPTAPTPTELPRAGHTVGLSRIMLIAFSLIIAGVITQVALLPRKK